MSVVGPHSGGVGVEGDSGLYLYSRPVDKVGGDLGASDSVSTMTPEEEFFQVDDHLRLSMGR